ncbi:MAG: imidazole glycerol phosphate synthase subunit HisF [Acidovorax sp.]|nr:imidazole glycerol phosphate synthase subunit HisF [Acidovorax sp.]
MLRPRIIPCLLVRKGGLVKTVGFDKPKYVGDPLNAVRIFNEKEVDELMVVDIDATRQQRDPDYTLIAKLAAECRMPLAYGGGVHTVEQFEKLISLGVEKVAASAAAVADLGLLTKAAQRVGGQSVVVVIDVRQKGKGYEVFTHNGTQATGLDAVDFARRAEAAGVGEIVVNSIDRDGLMKGYDLDLVRLVRNAVSCPLTVLGGAGSLADVSALVSEFGTIGAAAGSVFVFKGVYRAVLINYPARKDKDALVAAAVGRG